MAKKLDKEELVKKAQQTPKDEVIPAIDADIDSLQNRLSETIGAVVTIKQATKGKGKLVINYSSLDQLDGIIARLDA